MISNTRRKEHEHRRFFLSSQCVVVTLHVCRFFFSSFCVVDFTKKTKSPSACTLTLLFSLLLLLLLLLLTDYSLLTKEQETDRQTIRRERRRRREKRNRNEKVDSHSFTRQETNSALQSSSTIDFVSTIWTKVGD